MIPDIKPILRKSSLLSLYVLGFIISFRFAIPSYITSSFFSAIIGEKTVGYVFAGASVVSLVTFLLMPKILKRYGNYKTAIFASCLTLLSLLAMGILKSIWPIILFYIISSAASGIISLSLDIFVEHDSANINTGDIRGVYLSIENFAWLICPFLSGLIVGQSGYHNAFLVAALFMIPIIFILFWEMKDFKDPEYKEFDILNTAKEILGMKDVQFITASFFLLQFFYAWMTIYMPIYMNINMGFDWLTIGKIFTVMLLPFVILEPPLGWIADKVLGEKEILTAGFIIIAFSTAFIPFISNKNFWVWAIVLFITRVGSSMVEVMTDTYFFKKIGDKDANIISLYRSMIPLTYIIAPLVATLFLAYFNFQYLFFALAFIMLFGIRYSLSIKDTL